MMLNRLRPVFFTALVLVFTLVCGNVPAFAKPRLSSVSGIKSSYSASANSLTIKWSAVQNAGSYKVMLVDGAGTTLLSAKTKSLSKKMAVTALVDGQKYTINLQALATSRYAASKAKKKGITFNTRVHTDEFYGKLTTVNSSGRNGTLFLPKDYRLKTVPVMLLFHGSSTNGKAIANAFHSIAQRNSFIILAPDSVDTAGWQISRDLNSPTPDQQHIANCLAELYALPNLSIGKFIVAGHSAGGIVSSFYGSNDIRFGAFAVLHGGIVLSALGSNDVPVWLSTGTEDTLRPPTELKFYQSALSSLGTSAITYREYATDHGIAAQESKDLVNWWLGS